MLHSSTVTLVSWVLCQEPPSSWASCFLCCCSKDLWNISIPIFPKPVSLRREGTCTSTIFLYITVHTSCTVLYRTVLYDYSAPYLYLYLGNTYWRLAYASSRLSHLAASRISHQHLSHRIPVGVPVLIVPQYRYLLYLCKYRGFRVS